MKKNTKGWMVTATGGGPVFFPCKIERTLYEVEPEDVSGVTWVIPIEDFFRHKDKAEGEYKSRSDKHKESKKEEKRRKYLAAKKAVEEYEKESGVI